MKGNNKFKLSILIIVIGFISILIGEYFAVNSLAFKNNAKEDVANVYAIGRYTTSSLDLRRKVHVTLQEGNRTYSETYTYCTFNMPKDNKVVVYYNPNLGTNELKNNFDIYINLVWPVLGLIVLIVGLWLYINEYQKIKLKINKNQ